MLLPLVLLLDINLGNPTEAISQATGFERLLQDVVILLGIDDSIIGILIFISFIFVFKGALKFYEQAYKFYLRAELMREIRIKLFDQYSTMTYQYYNQHNAGHFINLVSIQTDRLTRSFEFYVQFLSSVITAISYFIFAFLISWQFACMAIFAGFFMLFVFRRLNSYVRLLSWKTATESGVLNHLLAQSMQAFKYLSSTAKIKSLRKQVIVSIERLTKYEKSTGKATALTTAVYEPFAIAVLILIIIVQISLLELPIAPIMVSLLLIYRAIAYVINIQASWQATMALIGSLEAVEDEFLQLTMHQQAQGGQPVSLFNAKIQLQQVKFSYNEQNNVVLNNINLTIYANSVVAFVGESGAGKSTLVDILTLILQPTQGWILIDNLSHDQINLDSWREQIGYVSQDTVIFDDTIANNICMWQGDYNTDAELRAQIEIAAKRAYAKEFIDELPQGFNTKVGDRGVHLSGGQRQRLFIARELFKKPRLLILDEATSSLDSESELVVTEGIEALRGYTTMIVIAHRLSTIKLADYIYVLDHGGIVEQGSYQELITKRSYFQRMLALQGISPTMPE